MSRSHAHSRTAAMATTLLTLLPLIYCVVATPLKNYDPVEDKPISNLQLLIPFTLADDQKSPATLSREYWLPHELPADESFSRIPSDSFTPDNDANFFTEEFIEPAKQKTVKKDLSQLETKTPRVRLQNQRPWPIDSVTDTEDYILRCQQHLRLLLERSEPKTSRKFSSNNLLRSLCLLHLKMITDNNNLKKNIFRSIRNKNTVLNSKGPSTAAGFLASLLGSEHSESENVGEKLFSLNRNNWKGELGNLAINGHGGYAGNLGVGGKGKDVGNLGVGGKGGVYGNLGIGGQGALFGNLGIGGSGGELDEAYISKDPWTKHYQNGLLNFLLNQGGHGDLFGSEQEENVIPKITRPVSNSHELPDDVAHETLVPQLKDVDYGRVSNNALLGAGQQSLDHTEIDKPHEGNQALKMNFNFNDQGEHPLHKTHGKSIGRDKCNMNNDCGLRSLLVGGKGGLIGNFAIDSYNYSPLSKQSPSLRVYAVAVVNEAQPELKSDSDQVESWSSSTHRPLPLKFGPISGRRDWTMLGNDNKLLRQYISKKHSPFLNFPENRG